MAIFLDSGDLKEVKKYLRMGIIRGVTTNPTILLKSGVNRGLKNIKKRVVEIAKIIQPYPLFVEVTSNDKAVMIKQAREFVTWKDNIVVKIPVHGPKGELANLEVAHQLETKYQIRINVTAIMSAQQCLLAALAGATYVSLFGGRINDIGYNCVEEIKKARNLMDTFNLKAKIIVGSTREVLNIMEWLMAGADFVTALPPLLEKMIIHPYTKETIQQFLQDARS